MYQFIYWCIHLFCGLFLFWIIDLFMCLFILFLEFHDDARSETLKMIKCCRKKSPSTYPVWFFACVLRAFIEKWGFFWKHVLYKSPRRKLGWRFTACVQSRSRVELIEERKIVDIFVYVEQICYFWDFYCCAHVFVFPELHDDANSETLKIIKCWRKNNPFTYPVWLFGRCSCIFWEL